MNLHTKFRVRLTIGVVKPSKALKPNGEFDTSVQQETVEHVCAYECDVIVNLVDAMMTTCFFWRAAFKAAAYNLLDKCEPHINQRLISRWQKKTKDDIKSVIVKHRDQYR